MGQNKKLQYNVNYNDIPTYLCVSNLYLLRLWIK